MRETILKDFPLISWVQAGKWSQIVDNFQPGDAEMWVPFGIPRKDMPNAFCLRVRGDSMIPEFAEGDIILVDPHRQPENGSFVIAKLLVCRGCRKCLAFTAQLSEI